jgi:Raf kinase inhibitor-like YbhB/YbcL family protein
MSHATFSLSALLIAGLASVAAADESNARFALTSPDIAQGQMIKMEQVFSGMGCTGKNISPALAWSHAPAGTKSFALLTHDPDAPTGSGWWHWVVYNIPASTTSLPADAGRDSAINMPVSSIVQGITDFGTRGYGGPCPPPGKPHRYFFRLFALKVDKLDVPRNASPAMIGFNVNANAIGKAQIMALYGQSAPARTP